MSKSQSNSFYIFLCLREQRNASNLIYVHTRVCIRGKESNFIVKQKHWEWRQGINFKCWRYIYLRVYPLSQTGDIITNWYKRTNAVLEMNSARRTLSLPIFIVRAVLPKVSHLNSSRPEEEKNSLRYHFVFLRGKMRNEGKIGDIISQRNDGKKHLSFFYFII